MLSFVERHDETPVLSRPCFSVPPHVQQELLAWTRIRLLAVLAESLSSSCYGKYIAWEYHTSPRDLGGGEGETVGIRIGETIETL